MDARVAPYPSAAEGVRSAPMLTHLERLEAESIHIFREVVAECERPVMLYSVGKDSAVMLHLARKAFYPSPPPFQLLHEVDPLPHAGLLPTDRRGGKRGRDTAAGH